MYNILICDDERDIVSALRIYLSAEGYRIFEAHTGREALDIVADHEIHLIWTASPPQPSCARPPMCP